MKGLVADDEAACLSGRTRGGVDARSRCCLLLSVVPPDLRPVTDTPHDFEHFAIFFATGLAFGFGYGRRPFVVAVTLMLFAGMVEMAQVFVPDRPARLSDFIVDALRDF